MRSLPTSNGRDALRPGTFGDGRQYAAPQTIERAAVAKIPRHRHAAALIEDLPFPWIGLQA
jgi:hypothetical protein